MVVHFFKKTVVHFFFYGSTLFLKSSTHIFLHKRPPPLYYSKVVQFLDLRRRRRGSYKTMLVRPAVLPSVTGFPRNWLIIFF